MTEKEVDARAKEAIDLQDPDIITDLRIHNSGQPAKYEVFFSQKTKTFIENVIKTAVDDRRHDHITHLATAIFVPDLLRQVKLTCPADTLILSEQCLRFQFSPKSKSFAAVYRKT